MTMGPPPRQQVTKFTKSVEGVSPPDAIAQGPKFDDFETKFASIRLDLNMYLFLDLDLHLNLDLEPD